MLHDIYQKLGDELSRQIYKSRLLYSMTADYNEAAHIIGTTKQAALLKETAGGDPCIIWGAGYWGRMIKRGFPDVNWKYYVDNAPQNDMMEGLQVYPSSAFLNHYKNEYVVIAVILHGDEIEKQLVSYGVKKEKIVRIGDYIEELERQQYFDLQELTHDDEEVFIDVGCFDGMTVRNFLKWSGNQYKEIVSFEPDEVCYKKCKETLADVHKYTIINKGLWSRENTLCFSATGDFNSKVMDSGSSVISVCKLDDVLNGRRATFIKMDIEGAEKEALLGAQNIISGQKPKLAVSIYHKKEDIWELPRLILNMNPQYQLYLRHYSLRDAETVLYAV